MKMPKWMNEGIVHGGYALTFFPLIGSLFIRHCQKKAVVETSCGCANRAAAILRRRGINV